MSSSPSSLLGVSLATAPSTRQGQFAPRLCWLVGQTWNQRALEGSTGIWEGQVEHEVGAAPSPGVWAGCGGTACRSRAQLLCSRTDLQATTRG